MVDVIRADHGAGELLEQIRFFIRTSRRVQESERIRAVLVADLAHPRSDEAERLVPGNLVEFTILSEEWARQSVRRTGDFVHVPAPHADPALICGVRYAGIDPQDAVVLSLEIETATHTTERARGKFVGHFFAHLYYRAGQREPPVQSAQRRVTQDHPVVNRKVDSGRRSLPLRF